MSFAVLPTMTGSGFEPALTMCKWIECVYVTIATAFVYTLHHAGVCQYHVLSLVVVLRVENTYLSQILACEVS